MFSKAHRSFFRLFLTTLLVAVATDSRAELVQLSNFTNATSFVGDFEFAPGVGRVIFSEDFNEDGAFKGDVRHLFSAIPNQPDSLVRITNIVTADPQIVDWKVSPNGQRVIMRGDLIGNGLRQLFTASTTQPGTLTRVDTNTQTGDDYSVREYEITPDGTRVVFLTDIDGALRLMSAPITGGPAVNLSDITSSDVTHFVLLQNSQQVIYRPDIVGSNFELFLASTSQAATSQKLTDLAAVGAQVDGGLFAGSPDGRSVVFAISGSNRGHLAQLPINPTGAISAVSPTGVDGSFIKSLLPPENSGRVQFTADFSEVNTTEAFGKFEGENFAIPLSDNSGVSIRRVNSASLIRTPNNARILYTGNLTSNFGSELFSSAVDSAGTQVQISQSNSSFAVIIRFEVTPDSARVVYSGTLEADSGAGLFTALVSTAGTQTNLFNRAAGQSLSNWAMSPGGDQVIFTIQSTTPAQAFELFSVPVDGSSAAEKIADITGLGGPDQTRVGFTTANVPLIGGNQMFSFGTVIPGPTPDPTIDTPRLDIRGKKRIKTRKARIVIRGKAQGEELTRVEVRFRNEKRRFVTRRVRINANGGWKFVFRAKSKRSVLQFRAVNSQGTKSKAGKVQVVRVRR